MTLFFCFPGYFAALFVYLNFIQVRNSKRLKSKNVNSQGRNTPQSAVPSDSSPLFQLTLKRREPKKAVKPYFNSETLLNLLAPLCKG